MCNYLRPALYHITHDYSMVLTTFNLNCHRELKMHFTTAHPKENRFGTSQLQMLNKRSQPSAPLTKSVLYMYTTQPQNGRKILPNCAEDTNRGDQHTLLSFRTSLFRVSTSLFCTYLILPINVQHSRRVLFLLE